MLQHLQGADLGSADNLLSAYDARTEAAASVFLESLPNNARGEARFEIDDGYEAALKAWTAMQSDGPSSDAHAFNEQSPDAAPNALRQIGSASSGLVQDAE